MKQDNKKIKQLLDLDKKISKLPELSLDEKEALEDEQMFESVYYSNRFEGNKLTKEEARKVIF